ncbi:hypothetical protein EV643_116220 [Kribbella sp. VKM Ac-2527]|uniref:MFS transporter n=1 Tax=Kribbella caucasensis TaxID=2512215 RepID=A0A4V3C985_9ACTN|nr:hypothetical protein [Kribbella sp. VKM Ac-2527]TDO44408.1 hypothetical protein EV643_116220 [Kribbella sp. VKM Ac-2527]
MSGLALGTLIYDSTGSPLLSALAIFGPSLAQVVGMTTLLATADRLPPRAALAGLCWMFAAAIATQALPGLPVTVAFGILFVVGVVSSVGGGVRWGLLNEILPKGGYLLGRSVMNMSVGVMQICGFASSSHSCRPGRADHGCLPVRRKCGRGEVVPQSPRAAIHRAGVGGRDLAEQRAPVVDEAASPGLPRVVAA